MSFWYKKKDVNGIPYGCVFRVGEDEDDNDIDDSQPPATAEEYLRRGMREVKNLTAIAGKFGIYFSYFNLISLKGKAFFYLF